VVRDLGLRSTGSLTLTTAQGPQELEQSFARLEIQGKSLVTHILISDTLNVVLIGVTTLEALGLLVDPSRGELRETEIYLL